MKKAAKKEAEKKDPASPGFIGRRMVVRITEEQLAHLSKRAAELGANGGRWQWTDVWRKLIADDMKQHGSS